MLLLEPEELRADGTAEVAGLRARHVRDVWRAAPGTEIPVGVINGRKGAAKVLAVGETVCVRCLLDCPPPPVSAVDLLLAMPRPKAMNRLWPVLAALGVGRILISNAARVERSYFDSHVLRPGPVRQGLLEGLAQVGDTRLPEVSVHRFFRRLVEDELAALGTYAMRLVAQPGDYPFPWSQLAERELGARVLLAVGPEGGWDPFELNLFRKAGFVEVSWGRRVLRVETACAVLLGMIHAADSRRNGR